jgi:hypothetical protein
MSDHDTVVEVIDQAAYDDLVSFQPEGYKGDFRFFQVLIKDSVYKYVIRVEDFFVFFDEKTRGFVDEDHRDDFFATQIDPNLPPPELNWSVVATDDPKFSGCDFHIENVTEWIRQQNLEELDLTGNTVFKAPFEVVDVEIPFHLSMLQSYSEKLDYTYTVEMPAQIEFLGLLRVGSAIKIFVKMMHEGNEFDCDYTFRVVGTNTLISEETLEYVGPVIFNSGDVVFHVFLISKESAE